MSSPDRDNQLKDWNHFGPGGNPDASPRIIARAIKGATFSFTPDDPLPRSMRHYIPDKSPKPRGWNRLGIDVELPSGRGATGTLRKRMRNVTREDMV